MSPASVVSQSADWSCLPGPNPGSSPRPLPQPNKMSDTILAKRFLFLFVAESFLVTVNDTHFIKWFHCV